MFVWHIYSVDPLRTYININAGVGEGAAKIRSSNAPLANGFDSIFGLCATSITLSLIGLTGLVASFHSIIYAYGRQILALSRAGYFPRVWSLTLKKNKTPFVALIGGSHRMFSRIDLDRVL